MIRRTSLFCLLLSYTGLSTSAQAALEIGDVPEIFSLVKASDVAHAKSVVLPLDENTDLEFTVDNHHFEGSEFSITGFVKGDKNSPFMLRGDGAHVYGWVYFRSEHVAYEYNTEDNGTVIVQSVPVRRVCSSCENPPVRPTSIKTALHAPVLYSIITTPTTNEPHLGDYPGMDLLTLQSRPGAKKVIYLNIAQVLTNGAPSSATTGTGTAWTKADIWRAWQTVASGFSAFDVNVTTSPTVFAATAKADVGVANFFASKDTSVCYQGTFGTGSYQCSIYITKPAETDALGLGRTTLHELGHLMGMLDAGTSTNSYYQGNDTYQWYPIMGNYYYGPGTNSVVQWSKGEWTNANSDAKIDALASIDKFLDFRADDIVTPKTLTLEGTRVSADSNRGQITSATDTDSFTFEIGSSGGAVNLEIDRIEYFSGGMLDVFATLKDSSGTTLVSSNPNAARSATIQQTLSSGTYTLVIQGGNEGTATNGFTSYGSLGFYGIEGTVTGSASTGTGGSSSTGGTSSVGGASATGGKSSTGGAAVTGGRSNAGGASATGGKSSTGGISNLGGVTSSMSTSSTTGRTTSVTSLPVQGGTTSSLGGTTSTDVTTTTYGGNVVTAPQTTSAGTSSIPTGTVTNDTKKGEDDGCACSVPRSNSTTGVWFALGLLPMLALRRRRSRR